MSQDEPSSASVPPEHPARRQFLQRSLAGLGSLALAGGALAAREPSSRDIASHFVPRVKRVIHIHLAGGPSQLELFDYKPALEKYHGQPCPPSFLKGKTFLAVSPESQPRVLGPQFRFAQHGQSGAWVSELLPHFAKVVDEVTFLKAVKTDEFNHGPAELMMLSGHARVGRPTLGAWTVHALGTENPNLPGYVVLTSGNPDGVLGKEAYGAGFLPSANQGVRLRPTGDPVLNLSDPQGFSASDRQGTVEAISRLNATNHAAFGDPEILARIAQYRLANRMQAAVPEAVDIRREPRHVHDLYGTTPEASFANNCLLARRLIERGVRYVQLNDIAGWDHHGKLRSGLSTLCPKIDRPMSALLFDLEQRGLLDDTLVLWAGEFGRTPVSEGGNFDLEAVGRDHHSYANTIWMAGRGLKPGFTYGETDELGFDPISGAVHVHDVHATVLHLLGFDHERLTYFFQGRDYRLTDVAGKVIKPILA
jgi:uncharacterized protein (DUF1501 family)